MTGLLKKKPKKLFNITRYFSIASAAAITVVTIILSVVFHLNAEHEVIEHKNQEDRFLSRSIANSIWPHFADNLLSASKQDASYLKESYITAEVRELLKMATVDLPAAQFKIYNLNGLIVYADNIKNIGNFSNKDDSSFKDARAGKATTKFVHRHMKKSFFKKTDQECLIKSLIPISRTPGKVEAIIEIVTDGSHLVALIWKKTFLAILGLLMTFGSLYGILMIIVRRADHIMEDQFTTLDRRGKVNRLKSTLLEREVLEREIAEQALMDSENRFRTLFDDSNNVILVIDPKKNKIIQFNNQAVNLLGYDSSDFKTLTIADIHPNDIKQVKQFLATAQSEGSAQTDKLHCSTKSGVLLPVELSASMIELDHRPMILMNITDISERLQSQQALQLSEERFRGAIESMDEGFALFDATEHLDVYNDKFVELHDEIKDIIAPGVTHSEILRAFVSRGVFPEAKGLEEEFIRMRLELRKQKKFDSAIRNLANGKSYIIRENYMDDGGVFVTFSDITKIQQANNRFRALFEQSHLGIFVHQNHKILMANPAAADMYGYDSVEEFVNISSSRQLTRPEYHTHENKKRMKGEQVITEAENIGIKKTAAIFGSANGRF